MRFENYNHAELEPSILEYWKYHKILEKLKEKNKTGKKFNFLQGPPYTSGKVHLGTAWNTVLKDMALRYKRFRGFKVWDRNGYDVHGLPTAHKVMAKHNLETKEAIEKFGVNKFMKECEAHALKMGEEMTRIFQRLGVTLDYSDSYMALTNDYMEGEWWLVKKAYENKRLYRGKKVMTWCQYCETALAKHECEYENVTDNSIFVKLKLKGKKDECLIIWTTTPWTIPFNLAVMVNPELDYLKVEVDGEKWILVKALAGVVVQSVFNKKMKVVEEFKGSEMEGWEYVHPFADEVAEYKELKEKHPNVHTVILSKDYVDTTAGSGLVHCAPGCGPEDQEAAKPYDLPAYNTLSEDGYFPPRMGQFAKLRAKVDDHKFVEALKEKGAILATTKVEHDYPHCWRCHKPIIFRTTKQWFFKIEDLREKMLEENQKVNWVPQTEAFDAWTRNLKDNSITRQRYWGTPVPIWKCSKCQHLEVIGSIKELKEKAGSVPKDLHRPWIDEIEWKCKCKEGTLKRIPDILDVWIDAGTASWNCLYYPQREDYFENFFPADLILEATEQVRLWFSMLSICSQLTLVKNPYKNVYMHGMLRDIGGVKMSKSLGNIISPDEMVDKHGADVLRYYMCGTSAGQDIRFSWEEAVLKSRHLQILWNVHKLLLNLAQDNQINPFELSVDVESLGLEEKYILSKLNTTIKEVTSLFDQYRFDETIAPLEELYLELSRTYIQLVREKSSLGKKEDKEVVISTIAKVLLEFLKMFSVVAPFISDGIYLNFKEEFGLQEDSLSHYDWPEADERKIDLLLEKEMEAMKQVIQAILAAREKAKLGVRWPVKEVVIVSKNEQVLEGVATLRELLSKQVNVKAIDLMEKFPGVKVSIRADQGKIGQAYAQLTPEIITRLKSENPEKIIESIDREKAFKFKYDGKEVRITREMLIIAREVPESFVEAE
ncbi:MAG: isoleucine--tRNA ligase, partial [Nanoarchaeota archaeon]|nr:isoleucine--tRNA ligase [Nanoarchaeota archaeon]